MIYEWHSSNMLVLFVMVLNVIDFICSMIKSSWLESKEKYNVHIIILAKITSSRGSKIMFLYIYAWICDPNDIVRWCAFLCALDLFIDVYGWFSSVKCSWAGWIGEIASALRENYQAREIEGMHAFLSSDYYVATSFCSSLSWLLVEYAVFSYLGREGY